PWTRLHFDQFGLQASLSGKTMQALYYKAGRDRLLTHGQRISISLNCQDFREEVRVHHAPKHLAAEAVFDGMSLEARRQSASASSNCCPAFARASGCRLRESSHPTPSASTRCPNDRGPPH